MGTLTADCPRLDTHCPHKLATSCRLTSTPNCCACADVRPHSRHYSVYIDGVGFVQRGTRWQSYCWFCKEFWNNRLAATDPPLDAEHTRIPHRPDQTEFLERWFEFHQGYRIVEQADGTENRIAVDGEPFEDVSPGYLPRSLDQLRARRANDATRAENRFRRRRVSAEEERPEEPHQSLEDALDALLDEASDEEAESPATQEAEQAPDMPPHRDVAGLSRPLGGTEYHLQRARERLVRLFGTREDVQRDDYVSPLSSMYNRAWDRYRQAEQRREEGGADASSLAGFTPQERQDIEEQLMWNVMQQSQMPTLEDHQHGNVRSYTPRTLSPAPSPSSNTGSVFPASSSSSSGAPDFATVPLSNAAPLSASITTTASSSSNTSSDLRTSLEQITNELSRLRMASEAVVSARQALRAHRHPEISLSLDNQPDRPPPLTDEEMTMQLACQVCYSQLADIAVLPCGHMVMCQWCADVVIPVKHSHVPVRTSKCPMCRKQVKQRFKIHMG